MVQCVQVAADRGAQTRPARTSPRRSGPFRLSRARCARAGTRSSAPGPTGPSGRPPAPGTRRRSAAAPAAAGPRPFRSAPRWNGDEAGFGNAVNNGMTWAAKAFRPLNQIMDLVFVEQRGTAGSGLQTCPGLQPTSTTLDLAAISAAARRCLASASRDPRHDTTTSAVRDLDQVPAGTRLRHDQHLRPVLRRHDGPGLPAALWQPRPHRGTGQRLAAIRPLTRGRRARPAGLQPDRHRCAATSACARSPPPPPTWPPSWPG